MQDSHVAFQVVDWLKRRSQPCEASPISCTIRGHTWYGALYRAAESASPQHHVVTDGPMRTGDPINTYRLYLVGERPVGRRDQRRRGIPCLPQVHNVFCWTLPESRRLPLEPCFAETNEWYTACYWDGVWNSDPKEIKDIHPFGLNFVLTLHHQMNFGYYKDWKIDTGEPRPYARNKMDVEFIQHTEPPIGPASMPATHH